MATVSHAQHEYDEPSEDMVSERIGTNTYYIKGNAGTAFDSEGFISTAGFVVTNDGVVVYDSLGTPPLANKMLSLIREITAQPIKLVVVSHYHPDHIYGLQVFKDAGAEIWAPKGSMNYFLSDNAATLLEERMISLYPYVNEETRMIVPDRIITKDLEFSMGTTDFKIHMHGAVHSDGDMSLLNLDDKALFTGDLIYEGRIPYVGHADMYAWVEAIKTIRKMDLEAVIPGHGAYSAWPKDLTSLTLRYITHLIESTMPFVKSLTPIEEVYDKVDWSEFESEVAFSPINKKNLYATYVYLENKLSD